MRSASMIVLVLAVLLFGVDRAIQWQTVSQFAQSATTGELRGEYRSLGGRAAQPGRQTLDAVRDQFNPEAVPASRVSVQPTVPWGLNRSTYAVRVTSDQGEIYVGSVVVSRIGILGWRIRQFSELTPIE